MVSLADFRCSPLRLAEVRVTRGVKGYNAIDGRQKRNVPCLRIKLQISLGLKVGGNIWDNVSTQLKNIYNIGIVIFGVFNSEKLHIVPLKH